MHLGQDSIRTCCSLGHYVAQAILYQYYCCSLSCRWLWVCEMGKKVRKLGRGEGKGSEKRKVKIVKKMRDDRVSLKVFSWIIGNQEPPI